MANYVTLLGADDVARAGSRMSEAADAMSRSAGYLEEALQRHVRDFGELVERMEKATGEPAVETKERFEQWGIVALFGHKQIAGRISEQTVGGETFIRVDVPTGPEAYHTQLFGKGAIYSMSLTDEAIARAFAERSSERPVSAYDVKQLIKDNAPTTPALSPRRPIDHDEDYP